MTAPEKHGGDFDVVIAGGALAGAAAAILLLRDQPQLRVLIVEKSAAFGRRVGEATVEVSSYFLCRVLNLTHYLNEAHLVKQGMRFYFTNSETKTLADCTEIGGKYLSRVPAFQVDRSALDEEVLKRAKALGAEIWRPATVGKIQLNPGGLQKVEVKFPNGNIEHSTFNIQHPTTGADGHHADDQSSSTHHAPRTTEHETRNTPSPTSSSETKTISTRWLIDASGVAALLARQEGWFRQNTEHPTTAVWARWTGVKDWDGPELAKKFPEWSAMCFGIRHTATNHICGPGWWAWVIPLKGGDVSIGVVFDQRLVDFPEGGSVGDRLKTFLMRHPAGAELLENAQWREGDVLLRKNLPYYSTTFAGDGFALVGDAAAFLDPFYSPGMDWVAFTTWSAVQLILAQLRGEALAPLIAQHNATFTRSYQRWFLAVYKDKYEYMGDYDLMRHAFQMDLGFYYLGVASQPFKLGPKAFTMPLFSTAPSVPFYHLMKFYNRRFVQIARARRRRNIWGRFNTGHHMMMPGFTFSGSSMKPVARAMIGWIWIELREGWRTWFNSSAPADFPLTAPAKTVS